MSNRKFVVPQITNFPGKPVSYLTAVLVVGANVLVPVTASAQAASLIYKRMTDLYSYATSYQGTINRVEKGKLPNGKSASQTLTVNISFKAPNNYVVESKKAIDLGGKSESSLQIIVANGQGLFVYFPDKKEYQRGPVQNENLLSRFFAQLNPVNGFLLLPEATVNGHPAFVLKPNLPAKATPEQLANAKRLKIVIAIDKKNYQLLRLTIESPHGYLTQTATGQTVNGSIPDSLFVWVPPVGYKEIKSPTTNILGGAPGL
jgi:outer membrane lipoprotein-sorting protein